MNCPICDCPLHTGNIGQQPVCINLYCGIKEPTITTGTTMTPNETLPPVDEMTFEQLNKIDTSRYLLDPPAPEVVGELVSALRAMTKERDELRKRLQQEKDENFTASACDRVNEILREHPPYTEAFDGISLCSAIRSIHGYIGTLTLQRNQWRECYERLAKAESCPMCADMGSHEEITEDGLHLVQCQWCDENPLSRFNALAHFNKLKETLK